MKDPGQGTPATAVEPAAVQPAGAADVQRVVLEIISERTGYPVDMIEPDLDLEADLSIDSIKRAEIAGELARRLGAGAAPTSPRWTTTRWRSWRRRGRPPR